MTFPTICYGCTSIICEQFFSLSKIALGLHVKTGKSLPDQPQMLHVFTSQKSFDSNDVRWLDGFLPEGNFCTHLRKLCYLFLSVGKSFCKKSK